MHKCEDVPPLPQHIELDNECLEYMDDRYMLDPEDVIGRGKYGIVFNLQSRRGNNQKLAVKLLPFDDDSDANTAFGELSVACKLNNIRSETPAFQRTFGWIVCDNMPKEWRKRIPLELGALRDSGKVIYIIMQRMEHTFLYDGYKLRRRGLLGMFWICVHGLLVARRKLGFYHNDIHDGNLMFVVLGARSKTTPTLTLYDDTHVRIKLSRTLYVKFIDYGNSSMRGVRGDTRNDILMLMGLFDRRATTVDELAPNELFGGDYADVWNEYFEAGGETTDNIAHFLATYNGFLGNKRIQYTYDRDTTDVTGCVMCAGTGEWAWGHKRGIAFCSEFCAYKVRGISAILPPLEL
jgi:hypothetical protein